MGCAIEFLLGLEINFFATAYGILASYSHKVLCRLKVPFS